MKPSSTEKVCGPPSCTLRHRSEVPKRRLGRPWDEPIRIDLLLRQHGETQNGGLAGEELPRMVIFNNVCKMDYLEEQREEVESLKSIFPDEFSELSAFPPTFMIRIGDVNISSTVSSLQLKVSFPLKYPDEIPSIEIPNRSNAMPKKFIEELLAFLRASCEEYIGMPVVFSLVDSAKEWINENAVRFKSSEEDKTAVEEADEEDNTQESLISQSVKDKLEIVNAKGGRWNFVIGLIGKLDPPLFLGVLPWGVGREGRGLPTFSVLYSRFLAILLHFCFLFPLYSTKFHFVSLPTSFSTSSSIIISCSV